MILANDGKCNENQIVSKKWIELMTTPYQTLNDRFGNQSYGFLWWIPNKDKTVFAAIGDCGNVIYVNPEKKIAAGVTGTFKPAIYYRVQYI